MPRPTRSRRIEGYPEHWSFSPDNADDAEEVILALDEYEAIRLIDRKRLTQEQCAARMGVARTTVTAIYENARAKLAQVIVDGKRLRISGGSYQIIRHEMRQIIEKGQTAMRIAVTYENGEIFQHFGRTEHFKLYDIEDGTITNEQIVETGGSGHGALAGFLRAAQVDALICGGIGPGAQMALAEAGVTLYGGVSGNADAAAKALAEDRLAYDPDAHCDHHDHAGEGHDCAHDGGHCCGA
ncbi:MAG: DUF134 domain-containing protein [Oscillospiraceae bacterium]|nr:DUF134 domain-containing protein [Oscillospiraceae bacterium]